MAGCLVLGDVSGAGVGAALVCYWGCCFRGVGGGAGAYGWQGARAGAVVVVVVDTTMLAAAS